jgi:hypothetical protein
MGRIASTLEADFSDFVAETQKVNAAMNTMQSEADQTTASFNRGAVAADKYGPAAAKSAGGVTTFSKSLGTAESALTALGVAGVAQVSNLGMLATSAAGAAAAFGSLGTAAAIAAAAFAGWKTGRMIAEANDLDRIIGNMTARMMGWGDESKEVAGYQQDLIDRAREQGVETTNAAQAAKVVADAVREQQLALLSGGQQITEYNRQLNNARGDGLPGLRKEIELGILSQDQLKDKYRVSAEAIRYLQGEMGKEKTARNEATQAAKAQGEALAEVTDARKGQSAILETLTDAEQEAAEAALAAGISQSTVAKAYGLTAQQVKAVAESMKDVEEAVKQFDKAQELADQANAKWNEEVMGRSATTTQALIADIERWRTDALAAFDASHEGAEMYYGNIEQIASEKLAEIKVDWDVLKEGALATYRDLAERAEATYQKMIANSSQYTTQAIDHARQVRDDTLATFEVMSTGHTSMYTDFLKRDQAYTSALKQFQEEAAGAQEAAYQKQNAALDRAIAYSQAYGVTIDEANAKLGQMGDTGEQAGQRTAQAMQGAARQITQVQTMAQQSSAQLETLARHYDAIAEQNKRRPESGLFWSPWQVGMFAEQTARETREKAARQRQYESAVFGGETWGQRGAIATTTNLSVSVNSTDAQTIAERLVTELRHAGVRFG